MMRALGGRIVLVAALCARGAAAAPVGIAVANTGHQHLLIDLPRDAVDLTTSLPADERHRHVGGGQPRTTIARPPGEHVLRLLRADHDHVPPDPPLVSEPVRITVAA